MYINEVSDMKHDEVGPWTKTKLDILRGYLNEYTKILSNQKWCKGIYYIDGFSSTGMNVLTEFGFGSEETAYINGSPSVALETEPKFTKSYFIELDTEKVKELEGTLSVFKETSVFEIIEGDSNDIIPDIIGRINWVSNRGFVLLDPYGMDIDWDTIELVGKVNGLELLVNLPIMAIQRECLNRKYENLDQRKKDRLKRFFGEDSIVEEIYKETGQGGLFSSNDIKKVSSSGEAVVHFYESRLKEYFEFVPPPRLMSNSVGGPLYYLIAAGQNETGMRILGWLLEHLGK